MQAEFSSQKTESHMVWVAHDAKNKAAIKLSSARGNIVCFFIFFTPTRYATDFLKAEN